MGVLLPCTVFLDELLHAGAGVVCLFGHFCQSGLVKLFDLRLSFLLEQIEALGHFKVADFAFAFFGIGGLGQGLAGQSEQNQYPCVLQGVASCGLLKGEFLGVARWGV